MHVVAKKTEHQPLVTIYIATHNRPQLLKRAIRSCVAQSYSNIEIIVVDDGSEAELAIQNQQISSLYPQVNYVYLPVAGGAPQARNKAINMARGEFITGLDDDDEFSEHRISDFIQQWFLHSNYAFLCSGYRVISANNRLHYFGRKARVIDLQQLLYANLVGNQVFTTTEKLRAIGGFDTELTSCQDYDTWLRLSAAFGSGYRISGYSYIVHQDHASERISASARREQGYQLLLQKHRQLMNSAQLACQQVNFALFNGKVMPWRAFWCLPLMQYPRVIKVVFLQQLTLWLAKWGAKP